MNILVCPLPFHLSIGGNGTVSDLLAEHFHHAGHRVVLVTRSAATGAAHDPLEVVRQPSAARLFAHEHEAEDGVR